MYYTDILRRSSRSLKSAKARTLLTALAIAVGTFALTMTLAASNGAQSYVNKIISDNFDPAELIVAKDQTVFQSGDRTKPKEYDSSFVSSVSNAGATTQTKRLNDEDLAKIKSQPDIEQIRLGTSVNLRYITRSGQKKYVGTAQGFSPAQNPQILAGIIPKPLNNKNILLPEAYVSALGFSSPNDAIGKSVTLVVSRPFSESTVRSLAQNGTLDSSKKIESAFDTATLEQQFIIVGIMKKPMSSQPGTELYMFIGVEDAQVLNDYATLGTADYHKYAFVYARVKDGNDNNKLLAAKKTLQSAEYFVNSVEDTQKFLTQIISVLRGIVVAFGMIAIIASVFGIVNTMYISVLQRTSEIGLMKALGMRKRDIGKLFRFEAAWIGFLGGIIGSLSALAVGTALNPWITEKLDLGVGNKLLIFRALQIIILIIILMIVAILAGLLPARKAAKLDPIEALRTE